MSGKTVFLSTIFLFLCWQLAGQNSVHDFAFEREPSPGITGKQNRTLLYPWAGGMNSVRFSEIDMDLDGKKDLFIFEKNGNRILPFINMGEGNPYRYAPEYVRLFPKLHDWAILTDYNGDGKEDIFTYGLAGITVYKNISDHQLQFELVTDQLTSFYYNGYTNIYSSPDDYLAFVDVDGDGDLDILNFWVLGKFVHYQKNWAMENDGNPENFDFRLEDECWGKFSEGADNNVITLFDNCEGKDEVEPPTRHVGSSMMAYDYNQDGLIDLILGDIDYPNVILLTNGGDTESALMVSQDTDFPNSNTPVHLFSMPVINFLDINHDGIPEMIASPSDPSLVKSQNLNSVWMYALDSITNRYERVTTSFLQEDMIDVGSGSYPILYDWDGDGLQDLFIGNYGRYDSSLYINGFLHSYYSSSLTYYKNSGTAESPEFEWITDDFGNFRQYGYMGLYPAFGDFNGDGKTDILCGNADGSLLLFINESSQDRIQFAPPLPHFQNIDVGDYSTPQYFDLDKDGRNDLMIGNRRGLIGYYRNISGTAIPQFEKVTDTLGKVDVRNFETSYFGYSIPHFFRNEQNETVLFCGSEQGYIYYYKNIDGNLDGSFYLEEALFELYGHTRQNIKEGIRSAPCISDLNNNGYPDLMVGNWAGGITYFSGIRPPDSTVGILPLTKNEISVYPNPCQHFFSVKIPDDYAQETITLEIFTITGQKLKTFLITGNNSSIAIPDLKNGLYLLSFVSGPRKKTIKLIKSDLIR